MAAGPNRGAKQRGQPPTPSHLLFPIPLTSQTGRERDYVAIEAAGAAARAAVLPGREDLQGLASAVAMSYAVQVWGQGGRREVDPTSVYFPVPVLK